MMGNVLGHLGKAANHVLDSTTSACERVSAGAAALNSLITVLGTAQTRECLLSELSLAHGEMEQA